MRTVCCFLVVLLTAMAGAAQDSRPTQVYPRAIDLRPWLDISGIGPRHQGHRPTCSVFAVTSALEAAVARIDGAGVRLSVEYLNWAGNAATGRDDDGDFFHFILAGFEKYGAVVDADWTYGKEFSKDAAPSDDVIARGRANQERWKDRLTLRWIKKIGPPGLDDSQYGVLMTALMTGHVVAVGSAHSRVIVGAIEDASAPGGRRFPTLDSGSGRYEELTAEWVRSTVNDAFYFMVDDQSHTMDPRERDDFLQKRATDLRPRMLGHGWMPRPDPGELCAVVRGLALCAEMVTAPSTTLDSIAIATEVEAAGATLSSTDDRKKLVETIERVVQRNLLGASTSPTDAQPKRKDPRLVVTSFDPQSTSAEQVHATVIERLLKTDPVLIETNTGDAVIIVGHRRSAAGSTDGVYRTIDQKSGRFVDRPMHEIASVAVATWTFVPYRVQKSELIVTEVPASRRTGAD